MQCYFLERILVKIMFCRECKENLYIDKKFFIKHNMKEVAFFDIETTGFDKEQDKIVLISLGRFAEDDSFMIKQYFADSLEEEKEILALFKEDIKNYDVWCSYNGMAFDEPFIKKRMESNGLEFDSLRQHVDLYRLIRPYYKQMGMERCNLKSVEKHIGIEREDKIDGGMSVQLYYMYLNTKEEELKKLMLLHNYEDVLNLPKIFELVYNTLGDCNIVRENCVTEKQLKFLRVLFRRNNININVDLEKISKKAASRLINAILHKEVDEETISSIINNSY